MSIGVGTLEPKRTFVSVNGREVHVRHAGLGPVLVLIHAFPWSASQLDELVSLLSHEYTVLALDLPGYGSSDPLEIATPTLQDYANSVVETLDELGIGCFGIFGTGTGALLALEVAAHCGNRVTSALLDELPCFKDIERKELIRKFAPEFSPRWDGGHLAHAWYWCRQQFLFRPWYKTDPINRLNSREPSPDYLNERVVDLMRAGPKYGLGPYASFQYDAINSLSVLNCPVGILYRSTDPCRNRVSEIKKLSTNITEFTIRDQEDTIDILKNFFSTAYGNPHTLLFPKHEAIEGILERQYVPTSAGSLLVRRIQGPGRPLVMLHPSPTSAALLVPLMKALATERAVLSFDTLGNGDSEVPLLDKPLSIADLAKCVAEANTFLGLDSFDLYGSHTGGLTAVELAVRDSRVGNLILAGVTMFSDGDRPDLLSREELLARYLPLFDPVWDGSHLLAAWNFRRSFTLYWPWYDRTPAGIRLAPIPSLDGFHQAFVELLKSLGSYHLPYRAALEYRTRERLPLVKNRTLVGTQRDDPLHANTEEACRLAPEARPIEFPADLAETAKMIGSFLTEPGMKGK
jgi:pimeloyl-ACP methyl ester carboxylesterase